MPSWLQPGIRGERPASSYGSCRQKKEETMLIFALLCSPSLAESKVWPQDLCYHQVASLCVWSLTTLCLKIVCPAEGEALSKDGQILKMVAHTPAKHPIWPFFVPSPQVPSLVCVENIYVFHVKEKVQSAEAVWLFSKSFDLRCNDLPYPGDVFSHSCV